jgi:hypothetical protein
MGDLDDSFAQLLGRQPTDKERQALYRVRDALKLKTTDAIWLLLMALQHYETLYERFPALIADAARDATQSVRATAEAQAKAAREETRKALAETVHETVDAVAKRRANAELFKWVSATVIFTLLALMIVGLWEKREGKAEGAAAGENKAKQECAFATKMSSWALTPDGLRAYEMEKVGSLHDLVSCTGRGLERKGDWCIAQNERGKPSYRWRLPGSAGDP